MSECLIRAPADDVLHVCCDLDRYERWYPRARRVGHRVVMPVALRWGREISASTAVRATRDAVTLTTRIGPLRLARHRIVVEPARHSSSVTRVETSLTAAGRLLLASRSVIGEPTRLLEHLSTRSRWLAQAPDGRQPRDVRPLTLSAAGTD